MGLGRFHEGLHKTFDAPATAERLCMVASWFRIRVILDCQMSCGDIGASKGKTAEYGNSEGFKNPMFI